MLPQAIKEYRKRHDLSQSGLASYLRVDKSSVSFWEAGKVQPGGPASILLEMLLAEDAHPLSVVSTNLYTKPTGFEFRRIFE